MKTVIIAVTSAAVGFTLGVITKTACDKFGKKKTQEKDNEEPSTAEKKEEK